MYWLTMAEKTKSECTSTYCDIMKDKPWRAALFDWQINRDGIRLERGELVKMVKKLNFNIYPSDDMKGIKETRNLSKTDFLKELQRFKKLCVSEPCGCILLTISSHGILKEADDQRDGENLKTLENWIFTSDYAADEEQVPLKEIFEVFRDETLRKIPKIFFIQTCRGEEVDKGHPLDGNKNDDQVQYPDGINRSHSTPYLDNSVIVYSTPFGYSAGSHSTQGSHVWKVLIKTLDEILKQVDVNGPVNFLSWLKETNGVLAKSDEFVIDSEENRYKPLLSICHTLTKQILFVLDKDPV